MIFCLVCFFFTRVESVLERDAQTIAEVHT